MGERQPELLFGAGGVLRHIRQAQERRWKSADAARLRARVRRTLHGLLRILGDDHSPGTPCINHCTAFRLHRFISEA